MGSSSGDSALVRSSTSCGDWTMSVPSISFAPTGLTSGNATVENCPSGSNHFCGCSSAVSSIVIVLPGGTGCARSKVNQLNRGLRWPIRLAGWIAGTRSLALTRCIRQFHATGLPAACSAVTVHSRGKLDRHGEQGCVAGFNREACAQSKSGPGDVNQVGQRDG